MIKNVHLGIFINEYNGKDYLYRELNVFDDAIELDRFWDYFNNNNDDKVRIFYNEEISEYFLDNIPKIKEVEKKSKKRFNGRLSAYYFDEKNRLHFLPLPKPGKIMIRDYKSIPNMEKCIEFLENLFEETHKAIFDKYKKLEKNKKPKKEVYVAEMREKFRQVSYELNDEEVLDLKKYYDTPTEERKKDCFRSIRTNVRRYFLLKAQEKEREEAKRIEQEEKERKANEEFERLHIVNHMYEFATEFLNELVPKKEVVLDCLDSAKSELQDRLNEVKKTNDYDSLFLEHDLDELVRDTNIERRNKL